jgi:hypothetical protein
VTPEELELIDGKPYTLTPWIVPLRVRDRSWGEDFAVPRYG